MGNSIGDSIGSYKQGKILLIQTCTAIKLSNSKVKRGDKNPMRVGSNKSSKNQGFKQLGSICC